MTFAVGTLVNGKYEVEEHIAEGGIGVIVAARHVALDQRVAIKFLKPKARANIDIVERFEREARLTAQMSSEHVVRVHDVGSTPIGGPYIVMELLTGKDLGAVIEQGPVPIARAVDWVLQACDALAEAHSMDIVHRDIKPENLFLTEGAGKVPTVKVIDFGISKMPQTQERQGHWARETGTNERFGTPFYMSPEQLRSSGSVDARSDIWSLGAVLFELLAGSTPFEGEDMARLCTSILTKPAKTLRMVRAAAPEGLEQIISKCLEKRPELRYRNVAELAQALLPYGPLETATSRVERIRALVSRAGKSIRPPTPATAMTVQSLLALAPPILPVRAGTMDSIVLPKERHPARALWVGGLVLGVAIATVSTVTLRTGHATAAAAHAASVDARQASSATLVAPPETIATSTSPAATFAATATTARAVITIAKKPVPTATVRTYDKPAASSTNSRARFGDRQ